MATDTPGPSPRAGEEEQEYERLAQWCDKRSGTHHEAYETAFVDTTAIARFRRIAQLLRAAAQGGEGDRTAVELAWVLIANASGGDWSKESADWQESAARWRDTWYQTPPNATRRSPDHGEGGKER